MRPTFFLLKKCIFWRIRNSLEVSLKGCPIATANLLDVKVVPSPYLSAINERRALKFILQL